MNIILKNFTPLETKTSLWQKLKLAVALLKAKHVLVLFIEPADKAKQQQFLEIDSFNLYHKNVGVTLKEISQLYIDFEIHEKRLSKTLRENKITTEN